MAQAGKPKGGYRPGSGRKSKSEELKLAEKLEDASDEIIAMMKQMAMNGDKDMIKLYMGYMYGNPKVKTENETSMSVSGIELKDILRFGDEDSEDLFDEFDLN
ncbi:hypothetical protein ABGT15_04375 [Flavobacterium enshiense]|uniref:hypothetical protein n=1 Tax=Flavobacterium enshiense TaxID=1341165 RepID=UPI00345DA34C